MPLHLRPIAKLSAGVSPPSSAPRIQSGRDDDRKWWRVGADSVELSPTSNGLHAQVRRADWGGLPLDLDGQFADEAEALAWCERMADVLARDAEDDLAEEHGPGAV